MHFVTPVVFAYTAGAQFTLVAAESEYHAGHDVQVLARRLVTICQQTGLLCGVATRNKDIETCLVSMPVAELEKSSGRPGLAVVIGVVTSTRSRVGCRLYPEVMQETFIPRLLGLAPGDPPVGLCQWAEELTHQLQAHGGGPLVEQCQDTVNAVAHLYTRLVTGYGKGTANWQPSAPQEKVSRLIASQTKWLYATSRDQLAYVAPMFHTSHIPDFTGRLTAHERFGDHLLICVETPGLAVTPVQ